MKQGNDMKLKVLPNDFSVCKISDVQTFPFAEPFCFFSRTDEELSLVCPVTAVPPVTEAREDGWKAFGIEGVLDFGLVGILARIASILAENGIAIFAVSTYNTDYVFIKKDYFEQALSLLNENGYEISKPG